MTSLRGYSETHTVDNRGDITPPDRLSPPILEDRLADDGDGMLVTFQESLASDLYEYHIFADVVPFADATNMEPVVVVNRNSELPFTICLLYTSDAADD